PEASAALSGFVQGGGYLLAATGPLLFGLLVGAGGSLWPAFVLVLASVGIKLAVTVPATRAGHI
ncbi:MFS transporter, partial [Mycobacterium tuberculosis]|nr:MFS transporter [Mycobacterium tuberculosis]